MNYQKTSLYGKYSIMRREGLMLQAYKDGAFYSIGFGHNGSDVSEGEEITSYEATRLFETDLVRFELCVNQTITVAVSQQQFDALVSLAFNIGVNAFANSTLARLINSGYLEPEIREAWSEWNHVTVDGKKKVSLALDTRRQAELEQFYSLS